jgi:hypothetical protein
MTGERDTISTSDLAGAAPRAPEAPASAADDAVAAPGGGASAAREPAPSTADTAADTPLFAQEDAQRFRARWQDVQTGFVDQPRESVEQADALVAELMQRLAQVFAEERSALEAQWGQGEDVGTEELRVALQRYRSFFERLLTT